MTCRIEDCGEPARTRGLCQRHYDQARWRGELELWEKTPRRSREPAPCIIEDCDGIANVLGTAWGLCSKHYHRWKRTGDPDLTLTELFLQDPICTVDGCEKPKWAHGFCEMHLYRWRTKGDPGEAEPRTKTPTGMCIVLGCKKRSEYGIHQMCKAHYLRMLRHGDPLAGGSHVDPNRGCIVEGCEGKHYGRDRCHRHWAWLYGPIKRARRKGAPGEATPEQIEARMAYFGYRCWMCSDLATCIDHVKPIAKGGSNWPANLRPACKPCNSTKQARWYGVRMLHVFLRGILAREEVV